MVERLGRSMRLRRAVVVQGVQRVLAPLVVPHQRMVPQLAEQVVQVPMVELMVLRPYPPQQGKRAGLMAPGAGLVGVVALKRVVELHQGNREMLV